MLNDLMKTKMAACGMQAAIYLNNHYETKLEFSSLGGLFD